MLLDRKSSRLINACCLKGRPVDGGLERVVATPFPTQARCNLKIHTKLKVLQTPLDPSWKKLQINVLNVGLFPVVVFRTGWIYGYMNKRTHIYMHRCAYRYACVYIYRYVCACVDIHIENFGIG